MYTAQYSAAREEGFRQQVYMAATQAAHNIITDSQQPAESREFARLVLADTQRYLQSIADSAVLFVSTPTDTEVANAVAGVWPALAAAYAAEVVV